ncbi:MAG: hypothetical protein ACYDBB_15135 [Armatimonadota bacterium]
MCAELFVTGEPYRLQGRRLAFSNWLFVRPPGFGWFDERGNNVMVVGDQGPRDAVMRHYAPAYGIHLRMNPAQRSGRVLQPDKPWEDGNECLMTVLQEQGRYRAWGSVGGWGDLKTRAGASWLCYFESVDGLHWERPACGLHPFNEIPSTNLLCRSTASGTVFIDPSAPPDERYKMIHERHFPREVYDAYVQRRPDALDPRAHRDDVNVFVGAAGAVSPDGLHWTFLPEPLVMTHTDTQVVAYYDQVLGKYVAYFRDWMAGPQAGGMDGGKSAGWLAVGRRAIGRAETDDFRCFPLPELIVAPGAELSPSQVYYTNCRTTLPDAPEQQVMFPAVWDTMTDTTAVMALSSHDGRVWNTLPGGPVLETAEFGQWDGGCIFPTPNLLELLNGDFALPYTGFDVPHKYPRMQARRSTGYAVWSQGRFVGIDAPERGEFTTVAIIPPGKRLLINAVTKRSGHITIEALDRTLQPIAGREQANAIPLMGDLFRAPVVWKGHDDLGIAVGEAVMLHITMEAATIYGFEFV